MVPKRSQPERSTNTRKKSKQPVIDQTIKSQLATFKTKLQNIRTYFLYGVDPNKITASDVTDRITTLHEVIAAIDRWEQSGIVEMLFRNVEMVKTELQNARTYLLIASGLLPPEAQAGKKWQKRPKGDSKNLAEAYTGISNALQQAIKEFIELE